MAGNLPGYANATAVKNALDLAGTSTQPADLTAYQATSEKGAADGYAGLDATGKVPSAQLPASAADFVSLTDTPADYSGQAGKLVKVNPTEDGLIYGDPAGASVSWGDISGTISDQTDLTPAAIGAGATDTANTWTAKQTFSAGTNQPWNALSGASVTITPGNHTWTLSGASTATISLADGDSCSLLLTAAGSTVTWTTVDVWAGGEPTLPAGALHIVLFNAGGTIYGSYSQEYA